ncbi:hypothetical protein OV427_17885 [Pyxidicoccus sp. MSG2]|nr:hypothetical protein [Pyxidicoccus sp. MSG2]MCY1017641.1 hypothetical protein [Pyxidicoccus sp. MSG2]
MRPAVAASKRSVLYSSTPFSPWSVSLRASVRSNFAVLPSTSMRWRLKPGPIISGMGAFWYASITWKRGERLESLSGRRASTSFSKGTSWCSYAPSATSRTRASSSRKEGSPSSRVRSTSVLTKKPMSPSSSAW